MKCNFDYEGVCSNAECPMYYEKCPVPDMEGICRHEDREEEVWMLTPKGCLKVAIDNNITLDDDTIDLIWRDFDALMTRLGYVKEN